MKTDKTIHRVLGSLLFLLITLMYSVHASAAFQNESLNYVITYKWGVVHKDAGEARLSLRNNGNNYQIILTARTKQWADKIFMVRDTLRATVSKVGFKPLRYEKISHEGGKYAKDVITYSNSGNHTSGKCVRDRVKKGKSSHSSNSLTATGPTFDMLSVFYYLRTLDYSQLTSGKVTKCTVFSGSKAETLTVRCEGKQTVTLRNKKKVEAYHIKFQFTTAGKKKSSDDIDAWLSADGRLVPVLLEGTLPVGKVKCYLLNY